MFKFIVYLAQCIVHYSSTTSCTSKWLCSICSVQHSISCSYIWRVLYIVWKLLKGLSTMVSIFHLHPSSNPNHQDWVSYQCLSPNIACLEWCSFRMLIQSCSGRRKIFQLSIPIGKQLLPCCIDCEKLGSTAIQQYHESFYLSHTIISNCLWSLRKTTKQSNQAR